MIIIDHGLHLAYVKFTGIFHAEKFMEMVMEIAFHPHYIPGIHVLLDYRDADCSRICTQEIKKITEYLMAQRKNLYHSAAIVIKSPDALTTTKLWQNNAVPFTHKHKFFHSILKAESWIFKHSSPPLKEKYHRTNLLLSKTKKKCFQHLLSRNGEILKSTFTTPLDGKPLPGRNVADFLHQSYLYPFMCMLKMVLKTQQNAWINLRIGQHDLADCISPVDKDKALVSEYTITNMRAYEVERLKWHENPNPQACHRHSSNFYEFQQG